MKQAKEENLITKFFDSVIMRWIAIGGIIVSICAGYFTLKAKVDTIQNNELVHIKADICELKQDNKEAHSEIKSDLRDINNKIDKLLAQ